MSIGETAPDPTSSGQADSSSGAEALTFGDMPAPLAYAIGQRIVDRELQVLNELDSDDPGIRRALGIMFGLPTDTDPADIIALVSKKMVDPDYIQQLGAEVLLQRFRSMLP